MNRYYDLVLGLIPLALLGISGLLHVAGLAVTTAVPLGATVAVGIIGHAMFVRAPGSNDAGPDVSTADPDGAVVDSSD